MDKNIPFQEIKDLQLEILKKIDKFCVENGIQYFLGYGTLLGSIRHKGYIPWDDDIDIAMPREDYMRFVGLCNNHFEDLEVLSYIVDRRVPCTFTKISNRKTNLINTGSAITFPRGVHIDVFPIDGLPDSVKESNRHIKKVKLFKNLLLIKHLNYKQINQLVQTKYSRSVKGLFVYIAKLFTILFSFKMLVDKIERLTIKYKYNDSSYVANIVHGYGERERVEKSLFNRIKKSEFEGHPFPIPEGYDRWLTKVYGDYMQLPPEKKRVPHHNIVAFWK